MRKYANIKSSGRNRDQVCPRSEAGTSVSGALFQSYHVKPFFLKGFLCSLNLKAGTPNERRILTLLV